MAAAIGAKRHGGFLQSFKFKNPDVQKEVCKLTGYATKRRGYHQNWWTDHTLYWQGEPIHRLDQEYQDFLDEAYAALAQNATFRRALLATGDAVLTHNIGKTDPKKTILTRTEFCRRLMNLRILIKRGAL